MRFFFFFFFSISTVFNLPGACRSVGVRSAGPTCQFRSGLLQMGHLPGERLLSVSGVGFLRTLLG